MALVLANPAPKNPQANLQIALKEYEQVLSLEERNAWRAQAVPNYKAAINLTTTIDNNSGRSQCVGPRLITFLESVQNFSSIVDTFVSSRPETAALIWGGVKLALTATTNALTYFNKLSDLFMRLGKTCPRISEFAYLYPSSERLQKALCDYYAVVIQLCKQITISSRMSVYVRLSKTFIIPFESEFGPFETKLECLSKEILEETSLASKQAQNEERELQARERQEARLSRHLLTISRHKASQNDEDAKKWRLERDRRRLEKDRLRALEALSTYDYQKSFKQARRESAPDTSTWICEDSDFQMWLKGPMKTIWCTGRIGSGKSVICASVIAYIMETTPPGTITTYFFCSHDNQESLKATTIFGTIARQLANILPAHAFSGFDFERINTTSIVKFLENTLDHNQQYFIILDGLDECEKSQVKEIAETFFGILGSSSLKFKIYLSSRPNIAGWPPPKVRFEKHIDLDLAENQEKIASDIRKFVSAALAEKLEGEVPEFQISDPNLVLIIVDRLEREAQGMFLWVKFQLQALCEEKSDSQILLALEDLPPNLPQTFDRILIRSIKSNDHKLVRRIFHWLTVTRRPLDLEELREAIGIEPLQESWDNKRFINNMGTAIASCRNLVFVDEEQQTVHFAHNSVKQYLLSRNITESIRDYHIDFAKADAEVGAICVTYLSFSIFKTQIERTAKLKANIAGVPSMTIQRVSGLTSANKLALALLHRRQNSGSFIDRQLLETYDSTKHIHQQRVPEQYSLLPYAKRFWLQHTKREISPSSVKIWALWRTLFEEADRRDLLSDVPWDFEDWEYRIPKVIRWVAANDHQTLAYLILCSHGMPDRKPNDQIVNIPAEMYDAMCNGTAHILVYSLLIAGAAVNAHGDMIEIILQSGPLAQESLDLGLHDAAGAGHLDIVQRLVSLGANVSAIPHSTWATTALLTAAEGGHLPVVELLLHHNANINAVSGRSPSRTALQASAGNGHLAVVERLLQAKADVNAAGAKGEGITALQTAARGGHLAIVNRLLQADADFNAMATQDNGLTALQAAALGGCLPVVERLLAIGAYVNAPAADTDGLTALQAAAVKGHLTIVERLLQAGADIDALPCRYRGRTALQGAAKEGHLLIVERLLQAGADLDAAASEQYGYTAIQGASGSGHLAIVERLLQAGADVNAGASERFGTTALQAASGSGHLAIVERLLQAGADVNAAASEKIGLTILQTASVHGHAAVVERLRSAGAKV